nr:mrna-binding protein puf3 [Quercus suber]
MHLLVVGKLHTPPPLPHRFSPATLTESPLSVYIHKVPQSPSLSGIQQLFIIAYKVFRRPSTALPPLAQIHAYANKGRDCIVSYGVGLGNRSCKYPGCPIDWALDTKARLPPLRLARMSNAWGTMATSASGNIWASTSRNNGLTSTVAARDGPKPGEVNGRATTRNHIEEVEGKTGSGSLVEHSVLDERSFLTRNQRDQSSSRSLSAARGSGSTISPRHTTNTLDYQGGAGAANTQSTYFGRLPSEYNLNTPHRAGVAMPPSTSSYKDDMSEPQPAIYTKFDRPMGPSQRTNSTSESWADSVAHLSPIDTRGPFSSQYTPKTMSASREPSQPPSSHSTDQFTFNGTEFSRIGHRATPNSSRAPSASSRRNSVYSQHAAQLPDNFVSAFGQMKFNGEHSRPSTSYRSNSSRDGYQSRGSSINPHVPAFGGTALGGKFAGVNSAEAKEQVNRARQHSIRRGGYTSGHSSLGSTEMSYSMKNMQTPDSYAHRSPVHGVYGGASIQDHGASPSHETWHSGHAAPTLFGGQNQGYPEAQGSVDPRHMQQLLATHFRNDYAALFNSYAMATNFQLGNRPFVPFFPPPMAMPDASAIPRTVTDSDGVGVQSTLLFEFKYHTRNRRWELKDIYDHIAEFAGDQYGSRFIQTKLEIASPEEKDRCFLEIEPNAIQLMTDVFGNYVIQKFFENGDQTHKRLLGNKMQGQVLNLSLQMYGCRVVQKALDHVLADQQADLVKELEGNVIKCVRDQNGNHVIQKAIERCPSHTIGFIMAALRHQTQVLSVHPYGCRVMQRCLEFCDPSSKDAILLELTDGIQTMICDQFGNYVVQHIVAKDNDGAARRQVLDIVIKGLEIYSKHKFASNVVEKCIEVADDRWRREVVYILTSRTPQRTEGESVLDGMLRDGYGNYVIRFVEALNPVMAQAKQTQTGKQLLSIQKKMQRFRPANTDVGLHVAARPGPGLYPMQLPTPPYAGHGPYGSATNTPPPLASDQKTVNTPAVLSSGVDVIQSTPAMSREGSYQPR